MNSTNQAEWCPVFRDPTGQRKDRPRVSGKTMVIDKGLGLHGFEDLLQTAGPHIDMIKIGFGTAPLYPQYLLRNKIEQAKSHDICIYPGGTFLEIAVSRHLEDTYFDSIAGMGFTGVEISDGTIQMDRSTRDRLIMKGKQRGLAVLTEHGKKCWGSALEIDALLQTFYADIENGAELVTVEGRESGAGVGIYDKDGNCDDSQVLEVIRRLSCPERLLWEAPQKSQQADLIRLLGAEVNLGNVNSTEAVALEALRRGLRSDTFHLGTLSEPVLDFVI